MNGQGLDILCLDPLRLDFADDRLRGAGVFAGGVGCFWPLGINANRDSRDVGDDLRAGDAGRGDGGNRILQGWVKLLLGMRGRRADTERERGDEGKRGKQAGNAEGG